MYGATYPAPMVVRHPQYYPHNAYAFDSRRPPIRPFARSSLYAKNYTDDVEQATRKLTKAENEFEDIKKKFDEVQKKYEEAENKLHEAQRQLEVAKYSQRRW